MKNKVLAALVRLTSAGQTVTVALSGGADSVVMTHCLASLGEETGIFVRACHFNHHLRGAESDSDEAFCREFCKKLGIPLTVGHGDVKARMARTGESLEEAARNLRYGFFAAQDGLIATAHTADDNAETVLLNLVRGTGLKGLGGIPEQRENILRPLLKVTRAEVMAYLLAHGLDHREDSTNEEDDCLRNRLRHRVLPLLKAENPNFLTGVSRMTENLRQDEALLQEQADGLTSVTDLQNAPEALRRRAIRARLSQIPKLSFAHIEAVEAIVLGDKPSAEVSLPGVTARREYDRLILDGGETPSFAPVTLPCPGQVTIPELGLTFSCEEAGDPITIRPRKAGDSIRLKGGSKTVKKLLIDKKIPAQRREMVPILERNGKILAVWGIAESEKLSITTTEKEENR